MLGFQSTLNPEVGLQRAGMLVQVRAEQAQLRPDPDATITGPVLNEMVYTRQVVKEVLRFRPPAPMVPQVRPAFSRPPLLPRAAHQALTCKSALLCSSIAASTCRLHMLHAASVQEAQGAARPISPLHIEDLQPDTSAA